MVGANGVAMPVLVLMPIEQAQAQAQAHAQAQAQGAAGLVMQQTMTNTPFPAGSSLSTTDSYASTISHHGGYGRDETIVRIAAGNTASNSSSAANSKVDTGPLGPSGSPKLPLGIDLGPDLGETDD
jgi:hypothetical protein